MKRDEVTVPRGVVQPEPFDDRALESLARKARALTAVSAAPSLRGEPWLAFLDAQLGGEEFSQGVGRILLDGPYQRRARIDTDDLLVLIRRWLGRVLETRSAHV